MQNIIDKIHTFEARSMHGQLPVVWKDSLGEMVWDINDKAYIDFTSGICVTNVGHSNGEIVNAIIKQARKGLLHSYTFYTKERAEFLEYLIKNTPNFIEKAFLLSSGTEACECAIKLMKMRDKRDVIISFKGAMHGRTLGAEFLKGKAKWIGKWTPDIVHFPFPYKGVSFVDSLSFMKTNGLIEKKICGIMIETYQGWSAKLYDKKYIQNLCKWAKENDIIICFDEIQGGMGRTGKLFNYMHYDVEPDLVCVGKGFSSSIPLSGVLGRKKLLDIPEVGSMSSTHSANPLACAVGLANFKEIQRILPSVKAKGDYLHSALKRKLPNHEINGKGLVAGIIMNKKEATKVCYEAMNQGLLLIHTKTDSIKIAPPLVISKANLVTGITILCKIIHSLKVNS